MRIHNIILGYDLIDFFSQVSDNIKCEEQFRNQSGFLNNKLKDYS